MAIGPETISLDELRAADPPSFAERDPEVLKAQLVTRFEEITGRTLFPAQVESYMVALIAYATSLMGEAVQTGFLQNRAIWATGSHLRELGARVNTFQLEPQFATGRVAFTLAEQRATAVVIPIGSRVAAGPALVFQTVEEIVIGAGDLVGEVDVRAMRAGAGHNDLAPGQIEDILDPVAFVSAVTNILSSGGGSDLEDEERFRLRVLNAFERISKSGSRQYYKERTKAVNPAIVDVAVVRPQPGYIEITPLMVDGIASNAVDTTILASFDPETDVPMGDYISIQKAVDWTVDFTMTLKVAPGLAAEVSAKADPVIRDRFAEWTQQLGPQVAPSALVEAARSIAGVVGVDGPDFNFTDLADTSFAQIGTFTLVIQEVPNV